MAGIEGSSVACAAFTVTAPIMEGQADVANGVSLQPAFSVGDMEAGNGRKQNRNIDRGCLQVAVDHRRLAEADAETAGHIGAADTHLHVVEAQSGWIEFQRTFQRDRYAAGRRARPDDMRLRRRRRADDDIERSAALVTGERTDKAGRRSCRYSPRPGG